MKRLNYFFFLFLATINFESHFDIGSFMTCEIELTNLKYLTDKTQKINENPMNLKNLNEKSNNRKLLLKLSKIKNTRILEDEEKIIVDQEKELDPIDTEIENKIKKKKNLGPNEFFLRIYCFQNGDNYDQKVQILLNCGTKTIFKIKYPNDKESYTLDNQVSESNPVANLKSFKYHNSAERNFIQFKPDKKNCAIYIKFAWTFKAFWIIYSFTFF